MTLGCSKLFLGDLGRMHGRKQWSTRAAVMALLVITAMAAEGGKSDKQGDKTVCRCFSIILEIATEFWGGLVNLV